MPDPKSITHVLRHHNSAKVTELFRKSDDWEPISVVSIPESWPWEK